MSIVDLAQLPRVLDPQLSPDGRSLLYMLTRADWKANRPVPHIWRQVVGGGAPTQLTNGDFGEQLARWSPDGSSILFLTRRTESATQIYLLPAAGGEARALSQHATSVSQAAWSPDGSSIYFVATDPQTTAERERERLRDDVFAFEETGKPRHLWKITVASRVEQKLTDGNFSVVSFKLASDGRRILVHRSPTTLANDAVKSEIWVIDADGGERPGRHEQCHRRDRRRDRTRQLAGAVHRRSQRPSRALLSATLFTVPLSGGVPDRVLKDFPYAIEHASWTADGAVLAVVNMGVHSEIFRVELAARRARALTDGNHSVQFWSLASAAGRSVFQLDEPSRIGDVWTQALDGGTPTRVTGIYDSLRTRLRYSAPGKGRLEGRGSGDGRRHPLLSARATRLVRGIHSSCSCTAARPNRTSSATVPACIVNYVPVLTAHGYAVLRPNYRGSSGYGDAFLRDVVGDYFRNMHLDVHGGSGRVDCARARRSGSAGGHGVERGRTPDQQADHVHEPLQGRIVGGRRAQLDRRSSRRPIRVRIARCGSAARRGRATRPSRPSGRSRRSRMRRRSRRPTLFFVGQDDPRVPMPQSVEMYRALMAAGAQTKLYVAPREGHQWGELRHQVIEGESRARVVRAPCDWAALHLRSRHRETRPLRLR